MHVVATGFEQIGRESRYSEIAQSQEIEPEDDPVFGTAGPLVFQNFAEDPHRKLRERVQAEIERTSLRVVIRKCGVDHRTLTRFIGGEDLKRDAVGRLRSTFSSHTP